MRSPLYLPAIGITTTGYLEAPDSELIGGINRPVSPRFFNSNETSYFDHPNILISAALHFKKNPTLRKDLRISDETKVFIDSGGYQLATGTVSHKTYNSKIALAWSEANGDIFPILDHPVTPGCNVQERLDISSNAAQYYLDNRSAPNKQILNVVSSSNISGTKFWYEGIKKFQLDGWAHGGHRGNMTPIIQTFLHLGNSGEFNKGYTVPYHVFGVSSQVAFIYFAAMQYEAMRLNWDVQLMSDSSSFQICLGHGHWMCFTSYTGIQNIRMSNKFNWSNLSEGAKMPCDCSVCSGITDIPAFINDPKQFYLLGAIHNLGVVLRYKKAVDAIILSGVNEMVDQSFPTLIANNLKAIRKAFEDPIKGVELIGHTFYHKDIVDNTNTLEGFF